MEMEQWRTIQLSKEQTKVISNQLNHNSEMLVFGMGNDTPLWVSKCKNTIFLEDNVDWFYRFDGMKKYLVKYDTDITDWKGLLNERKKLHLKLPDEIAGMKFDVILVDGPAGYNDDCPGRMKSIYMASRMVKKKGHIFVHDCDREVEEAYCDKYLGDVYKIVDTDMRWYNGDKNGIKED